MRFLFLALFVSGSALAQLQVSTPAASTCSETQTPVLGVAVHTNMGGSYGFNFGGDLRRALEQKGFLVVPEYSYQIVDKASIGVKGAVSWWKSRSGESSSSRLGDAHLQIYDVETKAIIFNVDQKAANLPLNAVKAPVFVDAVVKIITDKYCQQQ